MSEFHPDNCITKTDNYIQTDLYYFEDSKGRIVKVQEYRHLITNKKRIERSFQDPNLFSSANLRRSK